MNEVEGIRMEEFRQLKKEIRGSGEYLTVGIDVANPTFAIGGDYSFK